MIEKKILFSLVLSSNKIDLAVYASDVVLLSGDPREDAGGSSKEYFLRIPSVS